MRPFPVRLPSGTRYWTVVDDELRTVPVADAYLRHVRFGRDDAESTTKSYAGAVALYLTWAGLAGLDWRTAADRLGSFILWLRHTPSHGSRPGASVVLAGPGADAPRGPRRINAVLAAVRGFLAFAVDQGEARHEVLRQLYELADSRSLPAEARGEDGAWRQRLRRTHAQNLGHRHRRPTAPPRAPVPNQRRLRAPGPSPARERSQTFELTTASPTGGGHTLMGRFVSATGQFLMATYRQFSCPPTGSFSCPLTIEPIGIRAVSRPVLDEMGPDKLTLGPLDKSALDHLETASVVDRDERCRHQVGCPVRMFGASPI